MYPVEPIHCITVVWGEEYIKTFLDFSLPTQLTEGNLGALRGRGVYRIFTTEQDRKTIQASPLFYQLQQMLRVEFIPIPPAHAKEDPIVKMNQWHRHAVQDAAAVPAALIFLSPDIVLSHRVFAKILQWSDQGKKAVVIAAPRLCKETFASVYRAEKGELTSRTLVKLALASLHPCTHSRCWKGKKINAWPSQLYWMLDPQSFVARGFHLHPLFVAPIHRTVLPHVSIDASFLAAAAPSMETWEVVLDSDEMVIFEISPRALGKKEIVYTRASPSILGCWVLRHTEPFQRELAKKQIYFHTSGRNASWQKRIEESDRVIHQMIQEASCPSWKSRLLYLTYRIRNKIIRTIRGQR